MAIDLAINASFKVDKTIYKADMSLPAGKPTTEQPFVFLVTSTPVDDPTKTTPLLTVAIGADSEVFVAVSPPADLIAVAAGDVVQQLDVRISEGTYDVEKKTFKKPEESNKSANP